MGWNEEALRHWAESRHVLVSMPHASPNVFGQRMRVGWAASVMQQADSGLHHVRVVLTHTNLSDLGWRPYAWWTLDEAEAVNVARVQSRNKKLKHRPLFDLPALEVSTDGMTSIDRLAARRARWGMDLASSYILLMATVEAAAGLAHRDRTTYLPLDFFIDYARQRRSAVRGFARLLAGVPGRGLGNGAVLTAVEDSEAKIFDNATNIAALAAMGNVVVLGGAKMMGYWNEVTAASNRLDSRSRHLRPFLVPELPPAFVASRSSRVHNQLRTMGIEYSQGMAVTELGDFASQQDPFGKAFLRALRDVASDA